MPCNILRFNTPLGSCQLSPLVICPWLQLTFQGFLYPPQQRDSAVPTLRLRSRDSRRGTEMRERAEDSASGLAVQLWLWQLWCDRMYFLVLCARKSKFLPLPNVLHLRTGRKSCSLKPWDHRRDWAAKLH